MKIVLANRVIHDWESRVTLKFPYDKELISIIKELPEARWIGAPVALFALHKEP